MARAIKQGQHIFIAFQDGKAVLDSQLRPRMYKSREQFEKSFPAWRDGKAELVEYAPTLTPPNEWVNRVRELDELYTKLQIVTGFTAEMENLAEAAQPNEPLTWNELGNMVEKPVYIVELEDGESCWVLVHTVDDIKALFVSAFDQYDYGNRELYGQTWLAYRRPPEVSP